MIIMKFVIGGLIGLAFGTFILWITATLFDWPFALPFGAMVGSITFSALVGLFFGIWPARKAAKLDPATSLRYE
jgi:ABC-type antimicrobial peptide transport system permease subunit